MATVQHATASGTWTKTERGRYERITGEVIQKRGSQWITDNRAWGVLHGALSWVDRNYR